MFAVAAVLLLNAGLRCAGPVMQLAPPPWERGRRAAQSPSEAFRGGDGRGGGGRGGRGRYPMRHDPFTEVQGGSLRTWSQRGYPSGDPNELYIGTDGRPLDANVETWQGPGNTPRRMKVYSEDGFARPLRSYEPSRGVPNTMSMRNSGPLEFPMKAFSRAFGGGGGGGPPPRGGGYPSPSPPPVLIQGGATRSFQFDATIESVEVFLQSQGRNIDAKIEVLQGADCVRQTVELNEDWGYDRPFSFVLETPGYGSVVRILNTGPMTFPFTASVVPHSINYEALDDPTAQMGGGARPGLGGGYVAQGMRGGSPYGGQTSLGGAYQYPQGRGGGGRYERDYQGRGLVQGGRGGGGGRYERDYDMYNERRIAGW